MKAVAIFMLLGAFSPSLLADDYVVDYDHQVDFSAIRTFAFRNTTVSVNRPELKNQVVIDGTTAFIRSVLVSKGLKEVTDSADVLVDWDVTGQGFAVNPWGRAIPTEVNQGQRRQPWQSDHPQGGAMDSFIEGVLVLDMSARSTGLLIWRGVYRDNESDSGKLAKNLPANAKKLLSQHLRVKK